MSFRWPWALALLALIPAGCLAAWWWRRRRRPAGVAHPGLDLLAAAVPPPRWRSRLPAALGALATAALVVGLARPEGTRGVPREQATIMLAIDVSGSMQASDVQPTRLQAAEDAALRFAHEVPRQYEIGLVGFSGVASLLVPPTTDRTALADAVRGLVADGDTAIGDAVLASLSAIRGARPGGAGTLGSARILLLSDGSNRRGASLGEAAAAARAAGVPVDTVALGTRYGITPDGVPVPPDPAALAWLARSTGGRAFQAGDRRSVHAVYAGLGASVGTRRVPWETTAWWALAGSLLLAGAAAAGYRYAGRLA